MKSDLLCFIPEYLCSGFAEHIFKGVGCCAIILFQGVGVDVKGGAGLRMAEAGGNVADVHDPNGWTRYGHPDAQRSAG